jgi:hypothetical protein
MVFRWNTAGVLEETGNFYLSQKENAMKKMIEYCDRVSGVFVETFIGPAMISRADGGDIFLTHVCVKA